MFIEEMSLDCRMVINEEKICRNSKNRELLADVDVPSLKFTDNNLIIENLSSGQAGAEVAVDGSKVRDCAFLCFHGSGSWVSK